MKKQEDVYELDETDYIILEMLTKNARMSMKDIAKKVFLSSTAVASRIEKLEEKGIISGYHVEINQMKIGYYIKAFILVQVEPSQKDEFYPFVDANPNVSECNCVTGDYAILLKVIYKTTMDLDEFINQLQKYGKTQTLIVFSTSTQPRETFFMQ